VSRSLVVGNPLVTLGQPPLIEDGALVVEDSTIVQVGTRSELAGGNYDNVVGSPDHVVMPGFINGHFHTGGTFRRGLAQYVFERANIRTHGGMGRLSEEEHYTGAMVRLLDCVRGGQTCVIDFNYGRPSLPSFGWESLLQAYADLGLRVALGVVTRDENIYVHEDNETFIRRLPPDLGEEVRRSSMGYAWPVEQVLSVYRDLAKRWDRRDGLIRVILAPDWTPACSDALYRRNRELADEFDTGITTHVLETRMEMIYNLKRFGKTAVRRLADLGVLKPDVSCAHFVWATDDDLQIFADSGAVAVNNPASNLRLATGICRVRDIMTGGGRVAFGTDGISFSDRLDFFQELRLAAYLQRLPYGLEYGRLDSVELLRAAGINGARAARFEDQIGSLEAGKQADLLVVRRDRIFWPPHRLTRLPPLDVILDRADFTDLDSVMVAGRLIYQGGRFTTVNEARVLAAAEETMARLAAEEDAARPPGQDLSERMEPHVFDFYRPWYAIPVRPAYVYNVSSEPEV
jgi:5-methylthioadenosine/S-adenosylhomocysteine deaminase